MARVAVAAKLLPAAKAAAAVKLPPVVAARAAPKLRPVAVAVAKRAAKAANSSMPNPENERLLQAFRHGLYTGVIGWVLIRWLISFIITL